MTNTLQHALCALIDFSGSLFVTIRAESWQLDREIRSQAPQSVLEGRNAVITELADLAHNIGNISRHASAFDDLDEVGMRSLKYDIEIHRKLFQQEFTTSGRAGSGVSERAANRINADLGKGIRALDLLDEVITQAQPAAKLSK